MKNRIDSLDYLRGLMALGIMIYHYLSWTYGSYGSDTFLGIIGIYGVSIFYVLSGLTLYLVYHQKLNLKNTVPFFIKRFFRIYPLLWISITLTIFLLNKTFDTKTIFLNITGAFGFLAPDKYIATGAWSIGNELVFYSFFPIIILIAKKYRFFIELFFIISIFIGVYFAFYFLEPGTLREQWKIYINPFNQLFLFSGGIFIAKVIGSYRNTATGLFLILFISIVIFFYPVSGDRINLLIGWNRMVFSFLSFTTTIAFFITSYNIGRWPSFILKKLGHISYTVYLIHPIVFWYSARFFDRADYPGIFLLYTISTTLFISFIVYHLIESRFITLGRRIVRIRFFKTIM